MIPPSKINDTFDDRTDIRNFYSIKIKLGVVCSSIFSRPSHTNNGCQSDDQHHPTHAFM